MGQRAQAARLSLVALQTAGAGPSLVALVALRSLVAMGQMAVLIWLSAVSTVTGPIIVGMTATCVVCTGANLRSLSCHFHILLATRRRTIHSEYVMGVGLQARGEPDLFIRVEPTIPVEIEGLADPVVY